MSNETGVTPAPGGAKRRPAVVTVSGLATLIAVPPLVVFALPAFLYAESVIEVYREAYAGTVAEPAMADFTATSFYLRGGAALAVAAGLVLAGLLVLLGKRAGQLLTWVASPLVICGGLWLLIYQPSPPPRPPGAPTNEEIQQRIADVVPGWASGPAYLTLLFAVVALAVAVVLIALPPANDYFRKPPEFSPPPPPLHQR